jgi:hypothetical protein
MATTIVVRGTTVQFATTFYTSSGAVTNPTNAAVRVTYPVVDGGGVSSTGAAIAMTGVGNLWTASWESSVAKPGPAYWSVISSGAAGPYTREDGMIKLTANPANPD